MSPGFAGQWGQLPSEFAVQNGVKLLAGAAPQNQLCPSEEQTANSGHRAELQGPGKETEGKMRTNPEAQSEHLQPG